jgi:hypothetical protein
LFNAITTYRLTYPACCRLADPDAAAELLSAASRVDSLSNYTAKMWDILTDVVLEEWFGLRLPPSRLPWNGPVCLPNECRLLYCLDRQRARQMKADIERRYLSRKRGVDSISIFAGYGLTVPDDMERERDGLVFLAHQADHFRSSDDYMFIIQDF